MAKSGTRITPRFPDTFRAFKECKWDDLHTVILGQDPYPGIIDNTTPVADGLAFSSRYSKTCPKSLAQVVRAIDIDIYNSTGYDIGDDFDLSRWANQGILLLNTALSLPLGHKSGAHVNLWHPFITYVLKTINERKDSVAFILMGRYAKAYKPLLKNETFAIYSCEHPSASVYRTGGKWDHEGVFKAVDSFHKSINNLSISW
jgi:uracil-DNA glycosylase